MKKTTPEINLGEFQGCKKDESRVSGHHIPGWMQDIELYWLEEQAKFYDTIVEIGSWKGRSSYALASNCEGKVYCVDHYQGGYSDTYSVNGDEKAKKEFLKHMRPFLKSGKATLLEMTSEEAAAKCDGRVDMVFIDGAHDYASVKKDIMAWLPNTRLLMCGHDYDVEDVKKAVDEIFGKAVVKGFGNIWCVETAQGVSRVD